jgi:predicted nuclease with TOPRIM domain
LVLRYETQLTDIRQDYNHAKDQLAWKYTKLQDEKLNLLDEVSNLRFKIEEAKDPSRTATYFNQLNEKLKDLTSTIATCE